MRSLKLAWVAPLVLVAGCATVQREQMLGPRCEQLQITTKSQAGKVVEQFREITGFSEDCARFRLLGLVAQSRQDSELGQIASVALVSMMTDDNPEIKSAIQVALSQNGMNEADLQKRAAEYQIPRFAQNLNNTDGRPNMLVYGAIVDAHNGNKYPLVDSTFLQPFIRQELEKVGASYDRIARAYTRHLQSSPVGCEASTPADGQLVLSCTSS